MSVGLETRPLFTKNFAGGSSDTVLLNSPRVARREHTRRSNRAMLAHAPRRAYAGIAPPSAYDRTRDPRAERGQHAYRLRLRRGRADHVDWSRPDTGRGSCVRDRDGHRRSAWTSPGHE